MLAEGRTMCIDYKHANREYIREVFDVYDLVLSGSCALINLLLNQAILGGTGGADLLDKVCELSPFAFPKAD